MKWLLRRRRARARGGRPGTRAGSAAAERRREALGRAARIAKLAAAGPKARAAAARRLRGSQVRARRQPAQRQTALSRRAAAARAFGPAAASLAIRAARPSAFARRSAAALPARVRDARAPGARAAGAAAHSWPSELRGRLHGANTGRLDAAYLVRRGALATGDDGPRVPMRLPRER